MGIDVVLVGGQAINVWAGMYLPRIAALRAEGPFTSKDVDFLGDKDAVRECARRLKLRTIDFLSTVLGLDEHEVRDTAPQIDIGGDPVRVMHPVLCIFGRIPLILQLRRTDDQSLKRLRAVILCAREFLVDLLSAGDVRQVYDWNERIFAYAMTQDATAIYGTYGIDVFKAVLVDDRLAEKFRSRRYPQMCAQIRAKRNIPSTS